jgi:hypothetical protein
VLLPFVVNVHGIGSIESSRLLINRAVVGKNMGLVVGGVVLFGMGRKGKVGPKLLWSITRCPTILHKSILKTFGWLFTLFRLRKRNHTVQLSRYTTWRRSCTILHRVARRLSIIF